MTWRELTAVWTILKGSSQAKNRKEGNADTKKKNSVMSLYCKALYEEDQPGAPG